MFTYYHNFYHAIIFPTHAPPSLRVLRDKKSESHHSLE